MAAAILELASWKCKCPCASSSFTTFSSCRVHGTVHCGLLHPGWIYSILLHLRIATAFKWAISILPGQTFKTPVTVSMVFGSELRSHKENLSFLLVSLIFCLYAGDSEPSLLMAIVQPSPSSWNGLCSPALCGKLFSMYVLLLPSPYRVFVLLP